MLDSIEDKALEDLLVRLSRKYPTKTLLARALGVKYVTVAHWCDGSSYPSFAVTLKMLDVLGISLEGVGHNG